MEKLIEKEIEQLKNEDNVEAIAIVGSYARNPDQVHNDIDLFIIVDEDWRKRKTIQKENDLVFEYFYNSLDWSKKYIEEEIEKGDWNIFHWIKNAEVKYDPNNRFEELNDQVEEKKKEYLEEKINKEELLYCIWDFKKDIETNDVGQKRYLMYKLFDYLIDNHYKIKEEVPVKDNYKLEKLKDIDGYMYKLAQEFLTSSSTVKKEKKLDKMIDHVTRNLGDPNPEWETEKEIIED